MRLMYSSNHFFFQSDQTNQIGNKKIKQKDFVEVYSGKDDKISWK